MSLNTKNKRLAVIRVLPVPGGPLDRDDRRQVIGLFRLADYSRRYPGATTIGRVGVGATTIARKSGA